VSDSFEAQGFAVIPGVLADSECRCVLDAVLEQGQPEARLRAWLTHTWCQKLAISLKQHAVLGGIVAPTAVAVPRVAEPDPASNATATVDNRTTLWLQRRPLQKLPPCRAHPYRSTRIHRTDRLFESA
jgi:hypothetical protein